MGNSAIMPLILGPTQLDVVTTVATSVATSDARSGMSYQRRRIGGIAVNVVTFAICLPLMQRYRHARMPLITRRWYDIPLRAVLVATLVGAVVTLSATIGPTGSGILALYPIVFTSLMLILHPRIGGPPTAAVIANGGWGLMGFGIAIALMHVTALRFGSAIALSLALATCVAWNLGLWSWGRKRVSAV